MKMLSLLIGLTIATCRPEVKIAQNGDELQGAGVTFLVPNEDGVSIKAPDRIDYKGKTVEARTDGQSLTVNGNDFGSLERGDKVDLRTKGKVLVNGALREPAKKAE